MNEKKSYKMLTSGERFAIYSDYPTKKIGHSELARKYSRNESTIRTFLKSAIKKQSLEPNNGRPPHEIDETKVMQVIEDIKEDPHLSIRDTAEKTGLTPSDVWQIRHAEGFHYYKTI